MDDPIETILLICDDETRATRLMAALDAAGLNVVGPFTTAGLALAVTAQTGPTVAVLASQTTGRRSAEQLAQTLKDNWGVASMALDETIEDAVETAVWRAPDEQVARIREALTRALAPA